MAQEQQLARRSVEEQLAELLDEILQAPTAITMHINLRITTGLYYYTVQCHCATPEYLQALRQWMFDELGITVNIKKIKNMKQDTVSIGQ
eukprot:jgi/Tetstr1/443103/TSEL_031159.t1